MENKNLPALPDNNLDLSLSTKLIPSFTPDEDYNFEDIKLQFDEQVPFYEKTDFAVAAASGLLTALIDILLVGDLSLEDAQNWGSEKINKFVVKAANVTGYKGSSLDGAIKHLEKSFHMPGDAAKDAFGGGLQHHLRDFSHHPTLAGLFFSLLMQFTGKCFGTDVNGNFILPPVPVPGWMYIGKTVPEKILFGTIHWMFHLISDMAGSSSSVGRGTGIPGPILSFMKEMSSLPFFKNVKVKFKDDSMALSKWISKLFNGTAVKGVRFDLRTELGIIYHGFMHCLPVLANECIVRGYFLISRLCYEISDKKIKSIEGLKSIELDNILPFNNRRLTRMLTISSGTFFAATTSATVIKGVATQNYASIFVNLNYVGIARFAIAVKADYAYMKEDIKKLQDDIAQREVERTKYALEHEIDIAQFTLTESQGRILYSLELQKVLYDISKTTSKKKANKEQWLEEWQKTLPNSEQYPLITDEPELYLALRDEADKKGDKSWLYLVAMELYRFNPYYGLGNSVEEDKSYKSLRINCDYEAEIFTVLQSYIDKPIYKDITDAIKKYELLLNGTVKKIVTGVTTTMVITAASGGLAFAFAPTIAVALVGESFAGLSGVALTNASLAAVGGGALAAGGMGMSGGTAIITGGGALLSMLGSGGMSATSLKFLSSRGNIISECANILTYCDLALLKTKKNKDEVVLVQNKLKNDYEEWIASIKQMESMKPTDKDKKLLKQSKDNLVIIENTIKQIDKLLKRKDS
ncbi:hypothetical protein SAMN05216413_2639 [Ruminococcaceae bacterium KH2T8]|nr:hypothetical protein SAMN05216413_2639 [Ruminococcaceae bacterium KH2T8]